MILDHLEKAKKRREDDFIDPAAVTNGDFITAIIEKYNYEINAGVSLIREYLKLLPYMMNNIGTETAYMRSILKLEIYHGGTGHLINDYVSLTRVKYWRALFSDKEFTRSLPNNLQSELYSRIEKMAAYEFSYHNIMEMNIELNKKTMRSIEDTIIKLFDDLSQKYSWYDETSKNIHYFNGWKTNKAYKINKKVIIPIGTFSDIWQKFEYKYTVLRQLSDIEKCLAFLEGGASADIDMARELDRAEKEQVTKDIELKYFKVTFYKKGTCHLMFTNERLLEKFNIFGCQRKGWLPPCYGKKRRADMTDEEKAAVDGFGGDYGEVMRDREYYIIESGQFMLPAAEDTVAAEKNSEQPVLAKPEETAMILKCVDFSEKYEQLSIA